MTPLLLSTTTLNPWSSTPLNRRAEIPAKFSGRPEWNAGGDWDDARRAVSYRVIISAVAGGQELKNEIIHDQSEAMFSNLPPGQVKITITARNSKGGESAASEPVTATVT